MFSLIFPPLLTKQKAQLCSSAVPVCATVVELVSANVKHGPDKTFVVRKPHGVSCVMCW